MTKKNKPPAFQMYAQDFILGTKFMTSEQIGGYILLLCNEWDDGFIPNDLHKIKAMAKTSEENIKIILEKFYEKDGKYYNKKLETVRLLQKKFSKKQSQNGAKGGRPKKPNESQTKANDKANHKAKKSSSSSSSNSNNYVITENTHPLVKFVSETYQVSKLPKILTDKEAEKLLSSFPKELIKDVISGMENKKDLLKKYVSVYFTIKSWCTGRLEKKIQNSNNGQGANLTGQTANP